MTRSEQIAFAKRYGFDVVGPNETNRRGMPCSCCWSSSYHGLTCPEHGATGKLVADLEGSGMLVLSRKVGERIVIGEGPTAVVVVLVDIDRNKCRIGIESPRNVQVLRQELLTPEQVAELPRQVVPLGTMKPVALQPGK